LLSAGRSLGEATWSARNAIDRAEPGQRDWASMVVYAADAGPLVRSAAPPEGGSESVDPAGVELDPPAGESPQRRSLQMRRTLAAGNLTVLQNQAAELGDAAPPIIEQQIAELRQVVADLDAQLTADPP
jgi:hypothetical protein